MSFYGSLNTWWERLSRLGVSASMDPREAKRIILVNRMAVSILAIGLPYSILMHAAGFPAYNLSAGPLQAGLLAVLLLNRAGKTYASRVCYVFACHLAIFSGCVVMGTDIGIQVYFINTSLSALFLFAARERKTLVAAVLAGPLAWFSLVWLEPALPPDFTDFGPLSRRIMLSVQILTSSFIFLLEFRYLFSVNRRTESALAEALEAAKAADKAKSQFLANISHEVRTPLNGIMGLSEIVSNTDLTPFQADSVRTIRASSMDLLEIINGILDLSKLEAGKMQLEAIPFRLARVLESLRSLFHPQALRKGLQWSAEVDASVPDRLLGDPVRLKQVLTNLIGNAFKFTETGSVSAHVRLHAGLNENVARLDFEVADTGIGISPENQRRIFQPFLQADASTTRKYGGTGLGLHLSKELVELMGGSMGFSSEPGKGSRFHFSVPFALAPVEALSGDEDAGEGPDPRIAALRSRPAPRVLIVEDHPVNRKVLAAMLERLGWSATMAVDGIQGARIFSEGMFDLVFMDSHMPEMDGYECTRLLRAGTRQGSGPVILGVTADAMAGSRERCLQAGMDDMITKPIRTGELLGALDRWWAPVAEEAGRQEEVSAAAPARPGEEDWIDASLLEGMNDWIALYNPDFWRSTLEQFDASYRKLTMRIREACEAGRFQAAGEEAHALKGACATLGIWRMAGACGGLEALGLGGDTSGWQEQLARLESYREPSLAELRRILGAGFGSPGAPFPRRVNPAPH